MKEVKRIVEQYNLLKNDHQFAVATIIDIEGSSYRRIGTKMLIADNGNWWGGISGGCLEGDVLRKALQSISSGVPRVISYDTRKEDPHEIGIGLGCNGLIKIFINPRNVSSTINFLADSLTTRSDSFYILVVKTDRENLPTGSIISLEQLNCFFPEPDKVSVQEIKQSRAPLLLGSKNNSYFLQYHRPILHIVIFGSNYDAIITAKLATEVGYNTTLVAPKMHINKPSFKVADKLVPFGKSIKDIDKETAIILMNHDLVKDKQSLEMAINTCAFYIGLLGPKTRGEKLVKDLGSKNVSHVYFPAGLDTGASSPEEIALSILAEVKTVYTERKGSHLRLKTTPIYAK